MGTSILKKASGFLRGKGKYAAVLAGVLAVTTAGYRMALPGFTLERELVCGLEEHVHTEACFPPLEPETGGETDGIGGGGDPGMGIQPGEGGPTGGGTTEKVLACPFEGKEAHAHTADCYETGKKLTCGQEEGAGGHTHGDGCYTTAKELTCGQEESAGHAHDAACYQAGAELTCGQGESASHSHGDGCYDENGTATCGQEEGAGGHTHSDACYSSVDRLTCTQTESEGHTHGDGCYTETKGLACGQEESAGHTHSEGCYEEESRLVCGKEEYNPAGHVHGDGCYIEAPATGTEGNGGAGGAAPGGNGEGTGNGTAGGDTQGGGDVIAGDGTGDGTAGSGAEDSAAGSNTEGGTDKERQPICGLEEHTHTDACYGAEVMAVADNVVEYGAWWQLDDEGLLTITATDEATAQMPDYSWHGSNVPPWNEFKGQIKSVKVEGMKRIGSYAFYGHDQLEEVELSEGVKEIGEYAFSDCGMLANVSCPESLEVIDNHAFDECRKLADINISGNVRKIGNYAFYNCYKLSSIHLPDSIEIIGSNAFSGCSGLLGSIDIPGNVKKIESDTFNRCSRLTNINLPDGIVEIGNNAFKDCNGLTRMILPEGITMIGESAFRGCGELAIINLPDSLTQIGGYAFSGCNRLTNIKIPEGITKIENNTFYGCDSLADVQLPESLIQIGESAFSSCTGLSAIELPEGVTSIERNAFYYCTKLEEFLFGENVDSVGRNAFGSCSALERIVLKSRNLNPVQDAGITPANIRNVTIHCGSVDVLNETVLSWWKSADVSFVGPGYFTINGSMALGRPLKGELKPGNYYADEQGALYLLGDGKASLSYVPAGLEEYEVKEQISAKEGGTEGWAVTSVERDALKMADGLERLRFARRENIEVLPDYSCGNCPTLASVEGESTIAGVRMLFEAGGTEVGDLAFYNTGLEGEGLVPDDGDIRITVGDTILLSISTSKEKGNEGIGEGLVLYTGEKTVTTIDLHGQLNETDYTMARCYFAFENGEGVTRYKSGDSDGNYEFTLLDDKGNSYTVKARKAEEPFTYYYEIPRPKEGATLSFDIPSWYDSPTSSGGKVRIWPSLLKDEGKEELDSGGKYHQASWITKADEFPVEKSWYQDSKATPSIHGDGKEEDKLYLHSLAYSISMKREGSTLENKGKDYMRSADFTDTLMLPKEDGMRWRDGLLEAVEAGDVSWKSVSQYKELYVDIENIPYLLCRLSDGMEYKSPVVEEVDGEKTLKLRWKASNGQTNAEIDAKDWKIYFGDEVIQVDVPKGGESAPDVYHIINEVEAVQHFTHSGDRVRTAQATAEVSATEGNCEITKTADFNSMPSQNKTWGVNYQYTIALKNSGTFPNTSLTKVYDDLSSYLYIRPMDMQTMIREAEGMSGVERLEIVISNAAICSKDAAGAGTGYYPGKVVTGTDGQGYTLTWQDTGVGTEYNAGVNVGTDPAADPERKELTLLWERGQGTSLKVGSNAAPVPIKDAADIGRTLEDAGYVVTSSAKYKVTWEFENFILNSGYTKNFYIPVTVKDSFMLLDQDVLVKRNEEQFRLQNNTVKAETDKESFSYRMSHDYGIYGIDRAYRDYTLQKGVKRNSQPIDKDKDTVLPGDVLTYVLQIDHKANPIRGIVPLVDRMRGAQALLVPVDANGHLSSQYGLDVMKVNEKEYYLLSKEGEYRGVTLGGLLTDSITVAKQGNGELDTMIRWYLTDIKGTGQLTLNYDAYVSFTEEEEDTPLGRETDGKGFFTLSNESWLNDHQSHRLFSQVGLQGTDVVMEKMIVTSRGGQPDGDVLEEYSAVGEGNTTVYRLKIENRGQSRVITGSDIYDILPPALPEGKGFAWSKDNVTISYYDAEKSVYELENGDDWDIVRDAEGRCRIVWGNDFRLWLKGEIYIYVTLTWPEGDAWEEYVKAYGASRLENTFWCYKLWDKVTHELAAGTEAYLQKGVVRSNRDYISPGTDEQNRFYYSNKDIENHEVTYYAAIYNSGHTRLYLNELQDKMPRGFTCSSTMGVNLSLFNSSSKIHFTDADGNEITPQPKWVNGSFKIRKLGEDKIGIVLEGQGNSNRVGYIQYDELHQKYYLAPGEAVAFTYSCYPGVYEDTDDIATNSIAMPYFDPTGGKLRAADMKIEGPESPNDISLKNDGNCNVLTNQEAKEKGFIGGTEGTQWLASDVDVKRGEIIPGITKRVINVTSENGSTSNLGYANAADTVNWAVTVTNSGRQSMTDYTLTDAMELPYGYTGTVKYEINYTEPSSRKIYSDLFDITGCEIKEDGMCITLKRYVKNNVSQWNSWQLNGESIRAEEVEIRKGDVVSIEISVKESAFSYSYNCTWQYDVSLSDEEGETELNIRCKSTKMSIPAGGSATLSLSTRNSMDKHTNKNYVNKCFITPEVQQYDGDLVSQGNHLEHHGKPSVRNRAWIQVVYGYTTSSEKKVEELGNPGNSAVSHAEKNYIVLPGSSSLFRYTLTVDNTVSNKRGIGKLVLIDSLPQIGDHNPFTKDEPRGSEFQVSLAKDPGFQVTIRENGTATVLPSDRYRLEYSKKTDFGDDDWKGERTTDWRDDMDPSEARSFRIVILDEGGAGSGDLIPAGASIDVAFTGKVSLEGNGGLPVPGGTAWNGFGYRYGLKGLGSELESTPLNVGVRLPDVPRLVKELKDKEGNEVKAAEEMAFRFLVYQGKKLELKEGFTDKELAELLAGEGREFTCIDAIVEKGSSQSETVVLKDMVKWKWEDNTETSGADGNGTDAGDGIPAQTEMSRWKPTNEPWHWEDGGEYTIVELPMGEGSACQFGTLGGVGSNGHTFIYFNDKRKEIIAVNLCKATAIYELPETGGAGTSRYTLSGLLCLAAAGLLFGRKRQGAGPYR